MLPAAQVLLPYTWLPAAIYRPCGFMRLVGLGNNIIFVKNLLKQRL